MHPFPQAGLLGPGQAGVIGATYTASGGSGAVAVTMPAGSAPGHLALIFCENFSSAPAATGWALITPTVSAFTEGMWVLWKVLTAGDVSGGASVSNGVSGSITSCLVYAGPSAVAQKAYVEGASAASLSLTGFTKAAASQLIVAHIADRDTSNSTDTIAAPAGWTSHKFPLLTGPYGSVTAEILPALYTNGASVTFTGLSAEAESAAILLELT